MREQDGLRPRQDAADVFDHGVVRQEAVDDPGHLRARDIDLLSEPCLRAVVLQEGQSDWGQSRHVPICTNPFCTLSRRGLPCRVHPMAAKPFREYLKDLAQEHGVSVSAIVWKAANPEVKGLAPDTLRKALAGDRPLHSFQIRAIAEALGVRAEDVPHYRMAVIREELDERVVGPDKALAALRRLESGQQQTQREAQDEALELAEDLAPPLGGSSERTAGASKDRDAKGRRA